jgi:hypothetical protein
MREDEGSMGQSEKRFEDAILLDSKIEKGTTI